MSQIHAGPNHPETPGECVWKWYSDGVDLWCDDNVIPGGDLCADHLVQWAHTVHPYRRWFGAA